MQAALDLALEVGYAKLSREAVAARAGVGKDTIYRRWPFKARLFLHAVLGSRTTDLEHPDNGDLMADLREVMTDPATVELRSRWPPSRSSPRPVRQPRPPPPRQPAHAQRARQRPTTADLTSSSSVSNGTPSRSAARAWEETMTHAKPQDVGASPNSVAAFSCWSSTTEGPL
ncbi:TetR/AcrR family transcriptional regulator [Nonomuraea ceibae]|uniref:TetR/AcrR family transcriptional regulator n=1 Tax=Nonomuraea ceibae TaxID=1935170 RepID=UPI001C607231|nr:helix-turn-helix domain-containing protein [Nonomuraea ceibae]